MFPYVKEVVVLRIGMIKSNWVGPGSMPRNAKALKGIVSADEGIVSAFARSAH
jgi:hypothetical protein